MNIMLKMVLMSCGLFWFFSCNKDTSKILYINDTFVECTGVAPQKCLQIKEGVLGEWSNFYGSIDDFDFQEGFFYKIKVRLDKIDNAPADASSITYTLLKVLDKSTTPLSLDKGYWMVKKINDKNDFNRNPVFTFKNEQIQGNASCNKFIGKVEIDEKKFETTVSAVTKMMCPTMETERLFLETIKNVRYYKIEENTLQLLNNKNEIIIECVHQND